MRLRITDPADRDIHRIHEYGVEVYGVRTADKYIDMLGDELRWIAAWPHTSRLRDEVRPPVRLRPVMVHNVIYDANDEEVIILRIFHHSIDWQNEL